MISILENWYVIGGGVSVLLAIYQLTMQTTTINTTIEILLRSGVSFLLSWLGVLIWGFIIIDEKFGIVPTQKEYFNSNKEELCKNQENKTKF